MYFSEECDRTRLKLLFCRLKYPDKLINSTISRFIATKVSDQPVSSHAAVSDSSEHIIVILPFKDQSSVDIVRYQFQDLSHKIHTTVSLVFLRQKMERDLKMREAKPPLLNQQCLVYKFECDLCEAGYVGYTSRHLHQRTEEQKSASSSIGQHFHVKHSSAPKDLNNNFIILKKCKSKFDCLKFEMFFYELRPSLNVQSDSLRAKVFK